MISSNEPRPIGRMIKASRTFRMLVSFKVTSGFIFTLAASCEKPKLTGVMFSFCRAFCNCVEHQASWFLVIMPIFTIFSLPRYPLYGLFSGGCLLRLFFFEQFRHSHSMLCYALGNTYMRRTAYLIFYISEKRHIV